MLVYGFDLGDEESYPWFDTDEADASLSEAGIEGIEFTEHCSDSFSQTVMAANIIRAYRGHPVGVDLVDLVEAPSVNGWSVKLITAAKALGIDLKGQEPHWFLCSWWDGA
jgi:hypothetical protein